MFKTLNLDLLNFWIALLALIAAIYSIYYTKKCNRRKLTVTAGTVYTQVSGPAIFWFSLNNLSPIPITLDSIEFSLPSGEIVHPVDYEPEQTYTYAGPLRTPIADIISDDLYSNHLSAGDILYPCSSEEFGYYFDEIYPTLAIKITSVNSIHHFKKHQSFLVHFSNVEECTEIND